MELKKPVRGIFFDLGWTLLRPTSGNWMFSRFARKFFSPEKLNALPQERVSAALHAGAEYLNAHHRLNTVGEEYAQFLRYYTMLAEALPELGLTETDLEKITEDKVYNTEGNYSLFPDTLETLKALKALKGGLRLGVISDTWPSIVLVLEHFGLLPYFDCVTYSYTLGVYKPHPGMYRDALQKMALPPAETAFVDDFSGNLQGAREAGIQPVLIRSKPDPDSDDTMVSVDRLSDLLKLL